MCGLWVKLGRSVVVESFVEWRLIRFLEREGSKECREEGRERGREGGEGGPLEMGKGVRERRG